MSISIAPQRALRGELTVPGDKSISHRAVMLGALASGETRVSHFLSSAECLSTIGCFRALGAQIRAESEELVISGCGLHGLRSAERVLDTGNSGTTTRLLTGILAAQPFDSTVDGDASIRRRPMARILTPLAQMGARIESAEGGRCPLTVHGTALHGIDYALPVASAQLKSCLLLAGLYAEGTTTVRERAPSRDHTERMLRAFGAEVRSQGGAVSVVKTDALTGRHITVPGDISSAAFFLTAALILPNSELVLRDVGINPTRTGILDVLRAMGADIALTNIRGDWEPIADIRVRSSRLRGCEISGDIIPRLIDELPILAVAAAFAEGTTVIRDAEELKHKESNRIATMASELAKAGAAVEETTDGMVIHGGAALHGAAFDAYGDHRIAMSMAVCALACEGLSTIDGADCVEISYPSFFSDLKNLYK